MALTISRITHDQLVDLVHAAGLPVPIEQSPEWAAMEAAQPGREHWGCLAAYDGEAPVAVISLMRYSGRVMEQLSAKKGPVWLTGEPTPEQERELRSALAGYIRAEDPKAALVRLHARDSEGCEEPLVATQWDRTVILDIAPSQDEIMAAMSQGGRRQLRRGLANEEVVVADESDIDAHRFEHEIYAVFSETASRAGFGLMSSANYYAILAALRPGHARLYTARIEGKVAAWVLFTFMDGAGIYYYAASTHAARDSNAVFKLLWTAIGDLKELGVTSLDFYGISSPRAPELASLDQFKLKWTRGESVDVPGSWDLVLRPSVLQLYHARNSVGEFRAQAERFARRLTRRTQGTASRITAALDSFSRRIPGQHTAS